MPTSSGATPPPANWPAAPVKGENKLSPKGGTRGATGSCGAPSSVEEVPAEPPARVLKTSAVALATLVAARAALAAALVAVLSMDSTALPNAPAVLVAGFVERRNASPTAEAETAASEPSSTHWAIGAVAGGVSGSAKSPCTSAVSPLEAAGST